MKTVIVNRDTSLSVVEVPKPRYGPKQALTKTIANGICGSDVHIIKKEFKGIKPEQYPLMLGHENVGRIIEVGSEVRGLKVGDIVILPFVDSDPDHLGMYGSGWGGCSEYGVVNDLAAFDQENPPDVAYAQKTIPRDIDPVDAVMIVTLREVLSCTRYFGICKRSPVVVIGTGPVGQAFVKMCKMVGADPVIAVVRNMRKADIMKEMGADVVFNTSEVDPDKEIRKMYPQGVPFVIDAVGSETIVNEAMGLICDRGEICCYGVPRQEEIHLDFSNADYNWVVNFQQMPKKKEEGAVHEEIIQWIHEGKINLKDFISDYFDFSDVLTAYQNALDKKITKKGIVVF